MDSNHEIEVIDEDETVKEYQIRCYAFDGNESIETLVISDNVKRINAYAFRDLFNLKDSILPNEEGFNYLTLKSENFKKYFDANPFNTIELDTYMVHPEYRKKGLGTIVTFEGLKIQIEKLLRKRPNLKEIFISATIHQDNIPSKRVIQSFGDFDTLYVKRRTGINREVHFCKIEKDKLDEFMRRIERKVTEKKNRIEKGTSLVFKTIEL